MRGRGKDASNYNKNSSHDDSRLSSKVVARQTDENLAKYLTNQESIGDPSADSGGVLGRVLFLEQHIHHRHGVVEVAI